MAIASLISKTIRFRFDPDDDRVPEMATDVPDVAVVAFCFWTNEQQMAAMTLLSCNVWLAPAVGVKSSHIDAEPHTHELFPVVVIDPV